MSDYIPYEQRRKRAADASARSRVVAESEHANALKVAAAALRGAASDSHIEVLVPARGLTRLFAPTVSKFGVKRGPYFRISQVLQCVRLPEAVFIHPKDSDPGWWTPALITLDGYYWIFAGEGEGPNKNIYQVLSENRQGMHSLSTQALKRLSVQLSQQQE